MLLKSLDVSYCQLVRQFGNTSAIVSGVNYQGNLFVRGNSFPQQQRQVAITEMRRSYLDPEPAIACLLVEEDSGILTIWYEDRYITKVVENDRDIITYFDLAQLVIEMRSPQGIKIENRAQSFRLPYLRCFVGREAVDWMTKRLSIDRLNAVILGQRLIDNNWVSNISNKQPFKDGNLFYQFCMDK